MATRPGRVLAFRNDRLGARLITLINAMRITADHGLPLAVHWITATDIGAVFNDPTELFDEGFVGRHFIGRDEWRDVRDQAVRLGTLEARGIGAVKAVLDEGRDVLVDAAFGITVLGGEDAASVRAHATRLLSDFPFAAALRPTVAEIDRAVTGGTAYHIRRGDLISFPRAMHRSWPKKYVPDEIYMVHMERVIASGARPVVFSDDPATVARFRAAYPQLLSAADLFDASRLAPGQRDLMELYAMSRCARIIAPGQSAFSSTAADLGGAAKVEVGEDLAPGEKAAALERLATRLARAPGNDPAASEGDTGQSFLHAIDHLTATGRTAEAAAALARHVEAGLDISFLYPRLIELQLAAGDIAGASASGALMRGRVLYHRLDFANGEVLHGIARIAAGEAQAGLRHIANGWWHEPDAPLPRTAVGFLIETGFLGAQNFLPLTTAGRQLRRRMARDAVSDPRFAPLRALAGEKTAAVTSIPGLDPVAWDWGDLMRSFSSAAVARHPHRAGYAKAFEKLPPGADGESLHALFRLHCGEEETPLAELRALAARNPASATVHHRLGVALSALRDFRGALEAAAEAVRIGAHIPALHAVHGALLTRNRRFEEGAAALGRALEMGLALPSVRALRAQALARAGAPEAAAAELAAALADAPGEQGLRFDRALLRANGGDHAGAAADLAVLGAIDKCAPKIMLLWADCLEALGRRAEALAVLATGIERNPDNDRLTDRLAELNAAPETAATGALEP